jgi:hypothetical protein
MKTLITVFLISISTAVYSQKEISFFQNDTSGIRIWRFAHEMIDTVPVVMLVSDTATGITQLMFGYSVCDRSLLSKCRYLNSQKEPLPERFVVWMAVRRKPDSIHN